MTKSQLDLLKADPLLALFSLPPEAPSSSFVSASAPHAKGTQSVASLLQQKKRETPFSSGCGAFDSLLGSAETPGLPRGSLLELSGCPGEGKTRTCVSFAVNACLSTEGKEKGPRVLFIDTQGSLSVQMLYQAAQEACSDGTPAAAACERMILWACGDGSDFLTALYGLGTWLDAHPSIQLVIIDSLTYPLSAYVVPSLSSQIVKEEEQSTKSSNKKRRRTNRPESSTDSAHSTIRSLLASLVRETMLNLTNTRNLSVIVTTQSRTKLTDEFGENASFRDAKHSFAVPQFNSYWCPPNSSQIVLSAGVGGTRVATLTITPGNGRGKTAEFRTSPSGILDVADGL